MPMLTCQICEITAPNVELVRSTVNMQQKKGVATFTGGKAKTLCPHCAQETLVKKEL